MSRIRVFILFAIIAFLFQPVYAEITVTKIAELTPDGYGDDSGHGLDVDIDANGFAVVSGIPAEGEVVSYQWWTTKGEYWSTVLNPDYHHPWLTYANSVCISSNYLTLVTGNPEDSAGAYQSGSCTVFTWDNATWGASGWDQLQLSPSDADEFGHFGSDVACSGTGSTIMVGAEGDSVYGKDAGAVYIYQWWAAGAQYWETKLTSSSISAGDYFGHSVGVSGDGSRVIVGAYEDESYIGKSGVVYFYQWDEQNWDPSGWTETYFIPADTGIGDRLGEAVDISGMGSTIIMGAPGDGAGAVYIYDEIDGVWYMERITSSSAGSGAELGTDVALSADGNTAVIGSKGGVLILSRPSMYDTWEKEWFDAPKTSNQDWFGSSVAVSDNGSLIAVGDGASTGFLYSAGSVYVYYISR